MYFLGQKSDASDAKVGLKKYTLYTHHEMVINEKNREKNDTEVMDLSFRAEASLQVVS